MTKTKTPDPQFIPPHGRGAARVEIPKYSSARSPGNPWAHENGTCTTMLTEYIARLYARPELNDAVGYRRRLLEQLEPYFSANSKQFVMMMGNQKQGEEPAPTRAEGLFFGLLAALAEDMAAWYDQKLFEAREGYEWGEEERAAYEKDRKATAKEKAGA